MITINNELRDKAYNCAKAHGWHDDSINLDTELMLVITEVSEAVNADRKGKHVSDFDKNAFLSDNAFQSDHMPEAFKENFEIDIKDSVEDELADVAIRLLDIAGNHDIDLTYIHDSFRKLDKEYIEMNKDYYPFPYLCLFLCKTICKYAHESGEYNLKLMFTDVFGMLNYIVQMYNIDIDFFIEQKMKYNELREYKHGGKKY
jgi:NTP pyrophosphatase (non-canonical NTP hydrolase)